MRVGLIIYGSLETISGGYLYDRRLVSYLQRQGDEVEIISLPWSRYGRHLLQNLDASLRQRLEASSFDLLLQDELNHPSLFRLNKHLQRQGTCPIVSIVHHLRSSEQHSRFLRPLYRCIERAYLRTVDAFVFNSETTRSTVTTLARGDIPYIVAHPAADHAASSLTPEQIVERAHEPAPLRLIFVGSVIPRKGCETLLESLAELPAGSWQLKIVGDMSVSPAHVRQLKIKAYASRITPHIHWHGRLSAADLNSLLDSSHLLVVPSFYEGFGIVYLEGMNHSLPAIATTAGAAHEIIDDGINGYLVPPGDPLTLARRLQTLVEDRDLLARMSLAALSRARRHPTWEITMARVRQFLLALANSRRSTAIKEVTGR